ncbi:DUF58 domain-containing protein [Salipaludibacillus sp. LMS25]|uniref:DUF58 domain-containing protein n=1 Tax=Salipaludibacillus sp. LMS25 TaxID=2924031 RepID=UPI0020D04883|nr:DUF58 domain-containing protein [Salipaludibacillus sp. LMS25]UTR13630.1 DUF58 domain-containing protein [Salipaludibacillus sp. LMS25]
MKWLLPRLIKSLLIVVLCGSLFSYAMFQGGFVSWFLFYSISSLILLLLLYALIPLGRFYVTREFGDEVEGITAGKDVSVVVTVTRKWPFPFLFLGVEDTMEDKLKRQMGQTSSKRIIYPLFRKELKIHYVIPAVKRGDYRFFGVHLSTSDMFGLFHRHAFSPAASQLLVYPNYYHIAQWHAYEKRDIETQAALREFVENMTAVSGAREYVPGDKLTSVDWKVTARTNKLMTKEFEDDIGQHFLIIVNNVIPSTDYATIAAYERGIEFVTSIIMFAHTNRLQSALWTLGKHGRFFPSDMSYDHQKQLVTHLAQLTYETQAESAVNLTDKDDKIPSGASIMIVSTELTKGLLDKVKGLTSRRVQVNVAFSVNEEKRALRDEKIMKEIKQCGAHVLILTEEKFEERLAMFEGV